MGTFNFFYIPIYAHTEEKYGEIWQKGLDEKYESVDLSQDIKISIENNYRKDYPRSYHYNDVIGYARIAIDGERTVLVYFDMKGGRHKKYVCWASHHEPVQYGFENKDNNSIRNALSKTLDYVQEVCRKKKYIFNRENIEERMRFFDFEAYFKFKKWI